MELNDGHRKSIVEEANYFRLPRVLRRVGQWAICRIGHRCLESQYFVSVERLDEDDWISHMSEKSWVSVDDFKRAISIARSMRAEGEI